ncbi:hypothetical protein WDZ92_38305, partial [Nostoc sp. NIES-2111]
QAEPGVRSVFVRDLHRRLGGPGERRGGGRTPRPGQAERQPPQRRGHPPHPQPPFLPPRPQPLLPNFPCKVIRGTQLGRYPRRSCNFHSAESNNTFPSVRLKKLLGNSPILKGVSKFLCAVLVPAALWAISPDQKLSELSVAHWGVRDGLPEETFSALLAPGDGYVWLAANNGLVRFDGQRAQVFYLGDKYRPQGANSCSSNSLSSLHLDRQGQIWSGSPSGCLFQIQRDRFQSFANFQLLGIPPPIEDREKSGIISIRDSARESTGLELVRRDGIYRYQPGQSAPELQIASLPRSTTIQFTARDETGEIWAMLSDRKLYLWRSSEKRWTEEFSWSSQEFRTPTRMLVARDASIWVGTTAGLFNWRNGKAEKHSPFPQLPNPGISALHLDAHGCLWAGTLGAIARRCGTEWETRSLGVAEEEILSTVAEDPQGNLWFGGRWGNLYRVSQGIFRSFTRADGLPESHLTGVTIDNNGDVWA